MGQAATAHTNEMARSVEEAARDGAPRSLIVAQKGIKTNTDFANLMSGLMSDLIEGRVTPQVGNATCNAGGKLLKVVEMSYKYGTDTKGKPGQRKLLLAVSEPDAESE